MEVKRISAKKVRIADLLGGKFFYGSREEMKPSYLITDYGEKIFRVNILGTVIDNAEGENFSEITLDDSTAAIQVRQFGDKKFFLNVAVGDAAIIIGKIKEFNGERYISAEIVRRTSDCNLELLRKLEILKELSERMKIANELRNSNFSLEELRTYARENFGIGEDNLSIILESRKLNIDYKPKILEVIQQLDEGEGVEIGKLISVLNLEENVIESALNELLASGMLYEPVVGKLKRV